MKGRAGRKDQTAALQSKQTQGGILDAMQGRRLNVCAARDQIVCLRDENREGKGYFMMVLLQ